MLDEDLLQFIWSQKCYGISLHTTDGEKISIQTTGRWNQDAGPDFLDAKLLIGDTQWVGHVEVHVKSSLWHAHGHDTDPHYDATILHVVWEHTDDKLNIPTLQLKDFISPSQLSRYQRLRTASTPLACQDFTFSFPSIKWQAFRDTLLAERFHKRALGYEQFLLSTSHDWSELFYIKIARALGQKKNGEAMEELARKVPMRTISRHRNNLMLMEALLYGAAGMLPASSESYYVQKLMTESTHLLLKYNIDPMPISAWNMGGLRPANFPTIRIAQFSALLYQSEHLFSTLLDTHELKQVVELFKTAASSYWDDHYTFGEASEHNSPKKLGSSAIHGMIINTVIPILWAYGYTHQDPLLQERMIDWLRQVPAENNHILKTMNSIQLPNDNAMDSQSLIELYSSYCTPKKCLKCLIGAEIMSRTES